MKKILSMVLVVVMIMAMSIPAFANEATLNNDNPSTSITVFGNYENSSSDYILAVDITWDDLSFTYTYGDYDPETMTTSGSWEDTTKYITVANRSNTWIAVKGTIENLVAGVTVEMSELNYMQINSPYDNDGDGDDDAATAQIAVWMNQASAGINQGQNLANITLTIMAGEDVPVTMVNPHINGETYNAKVVKNTEVTIQAEYPAYEDNGDLIEYRAATVTEISGADTATFNAEAQTITFTEAGDYSVTVTATAGEETYTYTINFTVLAD